MATNEKSGLKTRLAYGILIIVVSTVAVYLVADIEKWAGAVVVTLAIMTANSIPARRFYYRRWLDWKFRKNEWLVVHEEDEPSQMVWSIAEYFGFPIVQARSPKIGVSANETQLKGWWRGYFGNEIPGICEFGSLPNKVLSIDEDEFQPEFIRVMVYHPRGTFEYYPSSSKGMERKAAGKSFELADPKFFDQIREWLNDTHYPNR